VFDCDAQDVLLFLISLVSTKHDLFSFKILLSKCEGWKGRQFYGRPREALSLAMPLSIY